jgi:hypothetical protein
MAKRVTFICRNCFRTKEVKVRGPTVVYCDKCDCGDPMDEQELLHKEPQAQANKR